MNREELVANKHKSVVHKTSGLVFKIRNWTNNGVDTLELYTEDEYNRIKEANIKYDELEWFDFKNCPQELKPYFNVLQQQIRNLGERISNLRIEDGR